MTADAAAAKTSDLAAAPSVLPAGVRTRILIYLGVLLVLLGFGSPGGGLIGLPISFLLKNKLHCHHGYLGSKLFSRISASATPRSRARRYQDRAVLRSPRALPAGSLVGARPRKSGSHQTPRWRKMDSNHRSRSCERLFWALPIGDGGTKGGATYRFRSAWSGCP